MNIEKKYIELINKEIDHTISVGDKKQLEKYLNKNTEARNLYNDLLKTENLLNQVVDSDPSPYLKHRILDSIDSGRYAKSNQKSNLLDSISAIFLNPKAKIVSSFALGLIAGVISLVLVLNNSSFLNSSVDHDTVGTIGKPYADIVQSIDINSIEITGKIDISQTSNSVGFHIDINSSEKYDLLIDFHSQDFKTSKVSIRNLENAVVQYGSNYIKLNGINKKQFEFTCDFLNSLPKTIGITILRGQTDIFDEIVRLDDK